MVKRTINEEARQGVLSARTLRRMLKNHELPGWYSGTRFYIDIEKLYKKLELTSSDNPRF